MTATTPNATASDASVARRERPRARSRHPLSPTTFLVRNAGKSLPLVAVIVLAVLLVAGVIAMMDSIPYSIQTIYRYADKQLAITPRGDEEGLPELLKKVRKTAPVPIERTVIVRGMGTQIQSIVGKWPFVVIAMAPEDVDYYLRRHGVTRIEGRKPAVGAPEALVSEPVARNLGLKIGSKVLGPEDQESYSPVPVKVVGIARTEDWIAVADIDFQRANFFPPVDAALVFAGDRADQTRLDAASVKALKGARAQVFTYGQIRKQSDEMFVTLYKILNVVIATLVAVITLMMGMLINIYQGQRTVEYGLLQAIGYNKRQLLRRSVVEAVLVVVAGWVLGLLAARLLLTVVKRVLMDPHAYALDVANPTAMAYTVPLPVSVLLVAVGTILWRFRDFDPVAVVERRLA